MKFFIFLFLSSAYLFSSTFWTLTGLSKANIYLVNEVVSLEVSTVSKAKEKMKATLLKNGIKTEQQDSPTLMMAFREIENDDEHYVYIELALGEDVQTYRDNKASVFAVSYLTNEFIEVDSEELDAEVLAAVDYLLSEFTEQFQDDKD